MKKYFLCLFIVYIFHGGLFAQNNFFQDSKKFAQDSYFLGPADSVLLCSYPELKLPDNYKNRELPYWHDNSQFPYLRPVFSQTGASCGQASGVAYNFTYEINRKRDLPADTSINQYPTHYTWNYMHGGNGWFGVSYFHSFEIIRTAGIPNVYDYGGLFIDYEVWMTGYEKYYEAMKNRIRGVYSIKADTPDGLLTLKHWLYDHLDGSEIGGVADYYAGSPWNFTYLPPESPEGGKAVITHYLGTKAVHAMLIVGYNDSIRYDFNEDGQFTNNIDINGDGKINMQDWEIGGVRFVNSYGDDWADSGFCYMMYKVIADDLGNGGIWNHVVHVLDAKEEYSPLLTMKVTIKHDSREKIKISAGISPDTASFLPEYILNYPFFNYQGGPQYMQGGTTNEENKTIEVGFDITPLLSKVKPGKPAKYFLIVQENDPMDEGTGVIINYSIIDYTNGVNEIPCNQSNVEIINNLTTRLAVIHDVDFDKVDIITDELPAKVAGQQYEVQLEAEGGALPYNWKLLTNYYEKRFESDFPNISEIPLTPNSPELPFAEQEIEFDFPFYGEKYNKLYIHEDGYVLFEGDIYPWPYFNDPFLLFKSMKNISVFQGKPVKYYTPMDSDGMWYEGDENCAAFRWDKTLVFDDVVIGRANFAVKLYPDGNIEYYYGDIETDEEFLWMGGVSYGDNSSYKLLSKANSSIMPGTKAYCLFPDLTPDGLQLTDEGVFSGMPEMDEKIYNLTFRVTDDNEISETKTLQFSDGLIYFYNVNAGNDSIIQFGETATLDVTVKNIFSDVFHNIQMNIFAENPYVEILNSSADFGDLQPGESKLVNDAFTFTVSNYCPDQYSFGLNVILTALEADWEGEMFFTSKAPGIEMNKFNILDGNNNRLDPGETVDFIIMLANSGTAPGENIFGKLTSSDPYITVNSPNIISYGTLMPGELKCMNFSVTASPNTPTAHEAFFGFDISYDPGITSKEIFSVFVGQYPVIVINLAQDDQSATAIIQAIGGLINEQQFADTIPDNLDIYKSIFLCLGTFYSNTVLSMAEGNQLANYLNKGGNLYMEGTTTWNTDPQTAVHPMFKIDIVNTSWNTFETINGETGTFTEGMSFDFAGTYNSAPYYMNYYWPAFPIFRMDNISERKTAIAYTLVTYNTIGSMIEFGSLETDSTIEDRELLMKYFLEFFGLSSFFVDISEPVSDGNIKINMQNQPNPFTVETNISFELQNPSHVYLTIFDLSGQTVKILIPSEMLDEGKHLIRWDGRDQRGHATPPGIYIFQLRSDKGVFTGKMIKLD